MLKNRNKNLVIIAAMVIILVVGAISAYFTSSDKAANIWTVGEIDIDLQEPGWDSDNPPTKIKPNQVFAKDPQIKNIGENDAYVFLKVRVPMANVATADILTGERVPAVNQELFTFTINQGWTQVGNSTVENINGTDYMTYVYAYGILQECTVLSAGSSTVPPLFNEVKFINAIEGQGLENAVVTMPIEAYGIQTTDITDNDVKTPVSVWNILNSQTVENGGAVAPYNDGTAGESAH